MGILLSITRPPDLPSLGLWKLMLANMGDESIRHLYQAALKSATKDSKWQSHLLLVDHEMRHRELQM